MTSRDWKCPHCSTHNPGSSLTCAGCGRIQGSVVVPGSPPVIPNPPPPAASPPAQPSEGWQAPGAGWQTPPADQQASGWQAAASDGTSVPAASTPLWRRLPIGWLIVGVLVFGGAIAGFIFNASRSSTGEINRSGDMTANDLRVGDCFDLKDPSADEIFDVSAHPCTEAHEYEVFFVGNMADGTYPTEDTVTTFIVDNCGPAFDAYVGKTYQDSVLDFSWLSPSDESWGDGDRTVQCAIYDPAQTRLTSSIKASAR